MLCARLNANSRRYISARLKCPRGVMGCSVLAAMREGARGWSTPRRLTFAIGAPIVQALCSMASVPVRMGIWIIEGFPFRVIFRECLFPSLICMRINGIVGSKQNNLLLWDWMWLISGVLWTRWNSSWVGTSKRIFIIKALRERAY